MKSLLQPGIRAPEFTLPAVNLEQEVSISRQLAHFTVIVFFGSWNNEITGQLSGFQERLQDFDKYNAKVIAISDATTSDLRKLAEGKNINLPILLDSQPPGFVARSYGVVSNDGNVQPAVFIVDQEGLIRRVYCPESGKELPNPAVVFRAIVKLANTPKPPLVTKDDWRLGSPEAPVVLMEYGDYQCGHCRQLYRVIRQLMPLYEDKVQFIFRHYPLRHLHPQAELAAEAAEAAGAQGKFWEMHARMFEAENALERENLIKYAREIGLDIEKFTHDLDNHCFANEVKADFRGATRNKIKFPPAFFINYILFDEPPAEEAIRARIDRLLACLG